MNRRTTASARQRAGVALLQSVYHLCLALGAIDRPPAFEAADFARQLRALVYQPQDVIIDGIDAVAQLLERIGHDCYWLAGR